MPKLTIEIDSADISRVFAALQKASRTEPGRMAIMEILLVLEKSSAASKFGKPAKARKAKAARKKAAQ